MRGVISLESEEITMKRGNAVLEMTMPRNCSDCILGYENEYSIEFECFAKPHKQLEEPDCKRPDWCPLRELTEVKNIRTFREESNRWIPVEECVPDEGQEVLVSTAKYISLVEFDSDYEFGEVDGVLAWMPLPKIYRPDMYENTAQNKTAIEKLDKNKTWEILRQLQEICLESNSCEECPVDGMCKYVEQYPGVWLLTDDPADGIFK